MTTGSRDVPVPLVYIKPLVTRVQLEHRRAVVSLAGELDLATVAEAGSAFDALRLDGCEEIVADVGGLSFIDSQGLQLLMRLQLDARESGWSFRLAGSSHAVRRLLDLTELGDFFSYAAPA
jgi:anti-sigma B factor antagonist